MDLINRKDVFLILALLIPSFILALDKLELTPTMMKQIFIKQNLSIIAQKMNISIADAEIDQAKLWDNPEFSIGDVNLWSSSDQRDGEDIPGVWGGFAKNTQFSIELSQMIVTANKKGKGVGLAKIQNEISEEEFEDFLRNLKTAFRTQIYELVYLQDKDQLLQKQNNTLDNMIAVFKKQYEMGIWQKNELLRLQSANYEIASEQLENSTDQLEKQQELKILLCVDPNIQLLVKKREVIYPKPESINIATLIDEMLVNRPDLNKKIIVNQLYG